MLRASTRRGSPSKTWPSGVYTLQMTRAVVFSPRSQGMMQNVDRSGMRYMSDSAMRAKPSIEDPSNHLPWLMQSLSCAAGMVTLLTTPSTSVNWRLTNRTFSLRTSSSTDLAVGAGAESVIVGTPHTPAGTQSLHLRGSLSGYGRTGGHLI